MDLLEEFDDYESVLGRMLFWSYDYINQGITVDDLREIITMCEGFNRVGLIAGLINGNYSTDPDLPFK